VACCLFLALVFLLYKFIERAKEKAKKKKKKKRGKKGGTTLSTTAQELHLLSPKSHSHIQRKLLKINHLLGAFPMVVSTTLICDSAEVFKSVKTFKC
jgi:hypothetical protein